MMQHTDMSRSKQLVKYRDTAGCHKLSAGHAVKATSKQISAASFYGVKPKSIETWDNLVCFELFCIENDNDS